MYYESMTDATSREATPAEAANLTTDDGRVHDTDAVLDGLKPKRQPSGAAVAGAHPRPKLYPRQLVIMVTPELADHIEAVAREGAMSKSEVGRLLLEAGIEAIAKDDDDR